MEESVNIARSYGFDITSDMILSKYSEPHRYFHTIDHVLDILSGIKDMFNDKKISEREYNILVIAAIFHDIVYNPKKTDNEEKSVEFMMSTLDGKRVLKLICSDKKLPDDIAKIRDIIIGTKTHDKPDSLSKKFNNLDTAVLDAQFIDMLDWENKIYKEYKWAGWKAYKEARIKFLMGEIKSHPHNVLNIKNLIDYVNKKVPKIGVCYYEFDKLPTINIFKGEIKPEEINRKVHSLFDDVIILISYDELGDMEKKMKDYLSNDEVYILDNDLVTDFIGGIVGDVTIIKEMKHMNEYNISTEKNLKGYKTIYI